MPTDPSTAKQFLLNTDYPLDQVIYKHQFSASIPTGSTMADASNFTIPHGLSFSPLCFGSYSDSNWLTSYDFGSGPRSGPTFRIAAIVESDATNVYISALNFDTTRTFSFQVVGLAPTTVNSDDMPANTTKDQSFTIDTDYNYMKLYMRGAEVFTNASSRTLSHGLGYVPTAMVFSEYDGKIHRASSEGFMGSTSVNTLTSLTEELMTLSVVTNSVPQTVTMHYRLYLDE